MDFNLQKTNKRILAFIITIAMVIGLITAPLTVLHTNAAEDYFKVGDFSYYILEDGVSVCVGIYTGDSKKLKVPSHVEYNGKTYTVTEIGGLLGGVQPVDKSNIVEEVAIPNTVTRIGNGAFVWCGSLRRVSIPNSVKYIGKDAFGFCGLEKVVLPDSIEVIDDQAFEYCCYMQITAIPSSVKKIGARAFFWCGGCLNMEIPDTVTEIGEDAFDFESFNFNIITEHGKVNLESKRTGSKTIYNEGIAFYGDQTFHLTTIPDEGYELDSLEVYTDEYYNDHGEYVPRKSIEIDSLMNVRIVPDCTVKAIFKKIENNQSSNNTAEKTTGQSDSSNNASLGVTGSSSGATNGGVSSNNGAGSTATGYTSSGVTYSSEWVNGKWYNADGSQTYEPTMSWKSNSVGWWIEDTSGWYPVSQWQKVDGYWYYFNADGYMASSEWRDGYYLSGSGALDYAPTASWYSDSNGWYFMDTSGWYPYSEWQKINGCWYYFDGNGYMVTSRYIDGYWIDANGVCK